MDNKVIEVFDYLSEKIGIAIDWTSENVMPQVTDFMERYCIYNIVKCGVWITISLALIFSSVYIIKKVVKGIRSGDENNIWYQSWNTRNEEIPIVTIMILSAVIIVFTICAFMKIFTIIDWSIIPELKFIEVFSTYLN